MEQVKNARLDARLRLRDGRRVLIEVKYRMNWPRACQAEWQFAPYAKLPGDTQTRRTCDLVIFGEFTGDWARPEAGPPIGWHHWYTGYARKPGGTTVYPLKFRDGSLVQSRS